MERHLSRDSAIVQFVFAFEKASVAAVKSEISVVGAEEMDFAGLTGSLLSRLEDGISFGSWLDVMGAGLSSPSRFGVGGGVGGDL